MKLVNLSKFLPYLVLLSVVIWVFRKFFFQQLLPIPSDILVGAYYPWLENKWGYLVGVPIKNPMPSDVISMLYPWRILGMTYIKQGILPLWDPTILLGTPLLANFQAALLNPFNFLYWLASDHIAWSIQITLQPLLISSAMYLYLKNLKLKTYAAILGGLAFAFCGFSIVWMEYNTIGYTLAYIPLIFLFIDRLIYHHKIHYSFLISILIALQIVSGYPQISLYTIGFSLVYFIYRLYFSPTNKLVKISEFLVGICSGFLLASIQLIPSFELTNLSIRAFDTVASGSQIQFLPLHHLFTFFIPDFFGNPGTGNYWSIGSFDNFAFSISTVIFFFFIISISSKNIIKKEYFIFLIIAVLSLVIASNNPISALLDSNQLLGLKSTVAARVLVFFSFSAIVISCLEINRINDVQKYKLFKLLLPLAITTGIIVGLLINYFYLINAYNHTFSDQASKDINIIIGHVTVALRNSVVPLLVIFASTLVLFFKKYLGKLIFASLFILLILDITRSTDKYLNFTPKSFLYPQMPIFNSIKEDLGYHRFDREKAEILPSNTWIPYNLKAASGQNALYPLSTSRYLSIVNGNPNSLSSRFVDITGLNSPLFNTLDIEYYIALNRDSKSIPSPEGTRSYIYNDTNLKDYKNFGTTRVLQNTKNLGLAWFPQISLCNNNIDEVYQLISKPEYDPNKMAYIGCQSNLDYTGQGSVKIIMDSPIETQFQVSLQQSQYLMISKAYYPGWKVYIDGKEGFLTSGNGALMAAFIPQGEHQIVLQYSPVSFRVGLYLTLLAFSGWILFFIVYLSRRKT